MAAAAARGCCCAVGRRAPRAGARARAVGGGGSEGGAVPAGVGFDPEGLFSGSAPPSGGHFDRRARARGERAPERAAEVVPPIPDGLPPVTRGSAPAGAVAARCLRRYVPLAPATPRLSVLHAEPPVVLVEGFVPDEECDALVEAALASGGLAPSRIGASTVGGAGTAASERRTSQTMLLSDVALRKGPPALAEFQERLRARAQALMPGCRWDEAGRLPAPGALCFEQLQVARYEPGQHFLAHEDAFSPDTARRNGFQRRATLLVYLNDVAEGGETVFHHLGPLKVAPRRGSALLFFPAFADGTPDARTLHTAADAVDVKWIAQQWVAAGWSDTPVSVVVAAGGEAAALGEEEEERIGALARRRRGAAKEKKNKKSGQKRRGFGGGGGGGE